MDAVCGVSSGAILGTLMVQGLVRGGNHGARREMQRLWRRVAQAHQLSPLQNGPLERWPWGWDLSNSLLWRGWEIAMRLFSPAQTAERLETHPDPAVQRSGALPLRTVDRATDLAQRTPDFSREGPLAPVALALLDEAAEAARRPGPSFVIRNQVALGLLVEADLNQLLRVLTNLLHNAADAGARSVWTMGAPPSLTSPTDPA